MTRRLAASVLAAMALAAALVAGCGAPNETKSGSARTATSELRGLIHHGVAHVDGSFVPIFHGRDPFQPGDSYIKWDRLDRGRTGLVVQYCVISPGPADTHLCTQSIVTPRGQIVAVAAHDHVQTVSRTTAAVVGGTGVYEGARGILTADVGRNGGFVDIRLK